MCIYYNCEEQCYSQHCTFSVTARDGHRLPAGAGAAAPRADAGLQDPAEHRQPRGVLQGAAHAALQ
jgi:hypothetical protein